MMMDDFQKRRQPLWTFLSLACVLLVVAFGQSVHAFASGCVNRQHCVCQNETRVICDCKSGGGGGGHLNLLPFMIAKTLDRLEIYDCDAVAFNPLTFSDTNLKVLQVIGVKELYIRALAFHNVHTIREITIKDTTLAGLMPHAFTNVTKLISLKFDNVTMNNVSSLAFNQLTDIGQLSIVGCTIDAIAADAFNGTRKLSEIFIRNSTVGIVETNAVTFGQVKLVEVSTTSFGRLANRSLTLDNVARIVFDDCHFGTVESHAIVVDNVRHFDVAGSRFDRLLADSLKAIEADVDCNVTFFGNHFKMVDEGAWSAMAYSNKTWPPPSSSMMTFEGNMFDCDSKLCWLLVEQKARGDHQNGHHHHHHHHHQQTSSVEIFLTENMCSADNASLAAFASTVDDEDVCGQGDESSGHAASDSGTSSYLSTTGSTVTTVVAAAAAASSSAAATEASRRSAAMTICLICAVLMSLLNCV